jgi:hypothetical protein
MSNRIANLFRNLSSQNLRSVTLGRFVGSFTIPTAGDRLYIYPKAKMFACLTYIQPIIHPLSC